MYRQEALEKLAGMPALQQVTLPPAGEDSAAGKQPAAVVEEVSWSKDFPAKLNCSVPIE